MGGGSQALKNSNISSVSTQAQTVFDWIPFLHWGSDRENVPWVNVSRCGVLPGQGNKNPGKLSGKMMGEKYIPTPFQSKQYRKQAENVQKLSGEEFP